MSLAGALTPAVWEFNDTSIRSYLTLAAEHSGYDSITLSCPGSEDYTDARTENENGLELVFRRARLLPVYALETHIVHKGETIGLLNVQWSSRETVTFFYAFLLLLMIDLIAVLLVRSRAESRSLKHYAEMLRVQAEELVQTTRAAESANIAKSAFLANMSHEIRTPMNAVLGFAELLRAQETDPTKTQYVESIHTSGKALLNLINGVLDLSKIEADKMELVYAPVSLTALFDDVRTILSQEIRERGLEFRIRVKDHLPHLMMDEARLRQILMNLIGNAIKFTRVGYIELSAVVDEAGSGASDVRNVTIAVKDTGIGIPEDEQERIFKAFEQITGQDERQYGGTGLGLAITHRLVEIMGGSIRVDSEVDKGSSFEISLPRVKVCERPPAEPYKSIDLSAETVKFMPATILISDDIDYNRDLFVRYLTPFDFELFCAENGVEVLELLKERKPDLILLDMKMPKMDGYEVVAQLQDNDELKDIPIVAITASGFTQSRDAILRLCQGYLRKPITRDELVSELMRHLPHLSG